jgi:8-oxo-dGTP pyrophosphatase MutT (NUDIX family)
MHHAKLDKWLQPGGHADGDENLIGVAKKELYEETGLVNFTYSNSNIFDLDIHTIPIKKDIPEHFHYDVRFHFIANNPSEIQKNHESLDLKWIDLSQVQEVCNNEKSIMRMVEKTIQMNLKQKTT